MKPNLLIVHGGGPTAVINCSLYGAVRAAKESLAVGRILGAQGGIEGVLSESFIDIRKQSSAAIEAIKNTPGSALGSCRYKLQENDYPRLLDILIKHNIRYFLYNGGNGAMTAALKIQRAADESNYDLSVIGIPKTIDNDIMHTNRCPGFGSAARYVAQSVRDLGMDIRSLPTPVSIFETMGRDAGWLAGAAALAKTDKDSAPHLIYLPERGVSIDQFVGAIDNQMKTTGWVVAVVSEGLRGEDGKPIFAHSAQGQLDPMGRNLPGDVGAYLAGQVSDKLKLRCRSEKPGLCGRSSMLHVSRQDKKDAEAVGHAAVQVALTGEIGKMVTLLPAARGAENPSTGLVALSDVAGKEKYVPDEWIDEQRTWVSPEFDDYALSLIGGPLLEYGRLGNND